MTDRKCVTRVARVHLTFRAQRLRLAANEKDSSRRRPRSAAATSWAAAATEGGDVRAISARREIRARAEGIYRQNRASRDVRHRSRRRVLNRSQTIRDSSRRIRERVKTLSAASAGPGSGVSLRYIDRHKVASLRALRKTAEVHFEGRLRRANREGGSSSGNTQRDSPLRLAGSKRDSYVRASERFGRVGLSTRRTCATTKEAQAKKVLVSRGFTSNSLRFSRVARTRDRSTYAGGAAGFVGWQA
jgi:hypothetical protein